MFLFFLIKFEKSPLDVNSVKGKKRFPYSQYYLFEGATANDKNFNIISSDGHPNYKISEKVKNQIVSLRKWAKDFLSKKENSCKIDFIQ